MLFKRFIYLFSMVRNIQEDTGNSTGYRCFAREFKICFCFFKRIFSSPHTKNTPILRSPDTGYSRQSLESQARIRSPTRSLLKIQFSDGERSAFPVRRMMTFLPFLCLYCLETACTGGGRDPNGSGGSGYGAYYIR